MKKHFIFLICLIVTGCVTAPRPTAEQINSADCGPFPSSHEVAIKKIVDPHLIDPYSAVYTFSTPIKAWNNLSDEPIYGWRVCGTINSKNRFGGYVGARPYYAFINNEQVVRFVFEGITIPDSFKMGMLSGNSGFYVGICGN